MPRPSSVIPRLAILAGSIAGLSVALIPAAKAQLYFDIDGATAGAGTPGAATWDTGSSWTTDITGATATTGWLDGSAAIFSAGTEAAGTWNITIGGTIQTNSITFNGAANTIHNISGGTINAGTSLLTLNASAAGGATGRSKTISSAIAGTGGLTIAANGDTSAGGGSSNTIFALTGANTFTGGVTITSGVVGYSSNFGDASNTITLNGGGIVGNTTGTLSRNLIIGASGGVLRTYGSATLTLPGQISGSGELRRTDGGTVILTGTSAGFTGALNLQRGTLQVGSGTQTASLISSVSAVTLGDATAAATLRYNVDSSVTLNAPVSIGNAGSTLQWQGAGSDDVLTVTNTLGTNPTMGTLLVNSGAVTLASGANVQIDKVQTTSTPAGVPSAVRGTINIQAGAQLTARYLNIGEGTGNAGVVNQTGGTVTLVAGSSGLRIGHWPNSAGPGSEYNLIGGTLDATALSGNTGNENRSVNIGVDGQATVTVGGGATPALLKAFALRFDRENTALRNADILTISNNGTVEVGTLGILSPGVNDGIVLNGGTLRATDTATWNSLINANPATTSTIDLGTFSVTMGRNITGTGTLALTGTGSLVLDPGTGAQTITAALTGTASITKVGAGTTLLAGASTYAGTISHNVGTLLVGASFGSATVNVGDGAAIGGEGTVNGLTLGTTTGAILNVNGVTAGALAISGNVTINPGSTVSLTPAPSTAGPFTLFTYGGTLTGLGNLSVPNAANYRTATIANPAGFVTLDVGGKSLVWNGATGGQWDLKTSARWNVGEAEQFYWGDQVTFDDTGTTTAIALTGDLRPGPIVVNSSAKSYVFAGSTGNVIGGGATLLKDGTSTLAINAPNTFTGGTTLSKGAIEARDNAALGTGLVVLGDTNSGANSPTLLIDTAGGTGNRTVANNITVAPINGGTAVLGSKEDATNGRIATYSGAVTLADDVILRSGADDQTTFSGRITGTGNISIENGTALGDVGGGNASNRVILSNSTNDFVGNITVKAGLDASRLTIFQVNTGEVVPNNSDVSVEANAVFRLNAHETINNLSGPGFVRGAVTDRTLTVGANNGSSTFAGTIENDPVNVGKLALTKIGNGTLTLTGPTTYTGATTISFGTIAFNRSGATTLAGALNGAGTLSIDGGLALTLGAGGNFSGTINVLNGSLIYGATGPTSSQFAAPSINLSSGTTLSNLNASTHGHVGNLSMNGATWTTDAGTGNYDGENFQLNGNVTVTGTATSTITRAADRTDANSGVSLNGQRTFTVNNVTGNAATDLLVSTQLEARDSGVIGGLTKEGEGTMELATGPTHNYAGPTTVNAGNLLVNAVLAGTTTTVNGGTLGGVGTLAATTIGEGGTLSPGLPIGTLNFSSTLTLAGTVNIELNKAGAVLTSDLLNVTGLLTLGGTLNVGASGDVLAEGDSFNLFDAGSVAGTFATLNLPALGSGLSWDTSGLPGSGSIVVVPEPNTAIAMIGGIGLLLGLRRRRRA